MGLAPHFGTVETRFDDVLKTQNAGRVRVSGCAAAAFFVLLASGFSQGGDPHKAEAGKYNSSNFCKTCHPGIHKYWSNSMHAYAVSDPAFQMGYARAIASYGVEIRQYCLSCHAPTTLITKDFDLKDPVTREGVTCDFCHTVSGVVEGKPRNTFEIQLGDTKFGPLQNIQPISGLEFKYSALHKSAKLCSGCHELEAPNGTKIIGTYSEWQESSYAKRGIQCQNCHMPELFDVPVVDPSVKKTSNMAHAHEFLGGHSQIRLEKAATMSVLTKRDKGVLHVDVFVTNAEAGHYLPTGLPTRKIVLVVALKNEEGKIVSSQERAYEKILIDSDRNIITETQCAMVAASGVKTDTRIKPGEVREEHFQFSGLDENQNYLVDANLQYKFEVATLERNVMTVNMVSSSKIIDNHGSSSMKYIIIGACGAIVIVGALLFLARGRHR